MKPFTHTLSAINLTCVRDNHLIFKALNFVITEGEVLCVQGANGAGKSSLLRLLAGLNTPYQGEVRWYNKNIAMQMACYHQILHYIGHTNGLKLNLTILENLLIFNCYQTQTVSEAKINSLLHELKLASHKNKEVKKLSAGQRRRIALARLFLWPKKLWLLDEPFTSLDIATSQRLADHMVAHTQSGGNIILSSHQALPNNIKHQTLCLDAS